MVERETWRLTAWLLGGVLGFAAIRIIFSASGLSAANVVLRRLGGSSPVQAESLSGLLTALVFVGILLACAASFVVVGRAGAPSQLWLSAAVLSVMQVGSLSLAVMTVALMGGELISPSEAAVRHLSAMPFASPRIYALAAVGYPLAAWLGGSLASRQSR